MSDIAQTAAPAVPAVSFQQRWWPLAERVIGYGLLIFAALATITPFLWMVSTSFKTDAETFQFPPNFIPSSLVWQNYIDAIAGPDTGRQLINSLVFALGSTASNMVFCALAGYQGPRIAPERLAPSDLVFFGSGGEVSHVGIYVGDGRFVHAPSTGGTVRLDRLDGAYWRDHYSGAKRVL